MSIPKPIGLVHFDEPRAVKVREPEDLKSMHSAVHCGVNIYTNTLTETQAVLAAWPVLMQTLADKVAEIVAAVPPDPEPATDG